MGGVITNYSQTAKVALGLWDKLGKSTISKSQYKSTRFFQLALSIGAYKLMGEPSVILAYVLPLYNVQYCEIARSYEQLQYRSVGNEFLAQQKGGNLGVRIDIILNGPEQYAYLNALKDLWRNGYGKEERYRENFLDPNTQTPTVQANIARLSNQAGQGNWSQTFKQSVTSMKNNRGNIMKNSSVDYVSTAAASIDEGLLLGTSKGPDQVTISSELDIEQLDRSKSYKLYDVGDEGWRDKIVHRTFPVVTVDEILFDMYIETIIVRRDITKGPRTLRVSILLRQYNPEPEIDSTQIELYWRKRELSGQDFSNDIVPQVKVNYVNKVVDTDNKELAKIDLIMQGIWRGQKLIGDLAVGKYKYRRHVPIDFLTWDTRFKQIFFGIFGNTNKWNTISVGGFNG